MSWTIGVRYFGGVKRVTAEASTTVGAFRQSVAAATAIPLHDVTVVSVDGVKFDDDARALSSYGVKNRDLVIIDSPETHQQQAAAPADDAAAAARDKPRVMRISDLPEMPVNTGYGGADAAGGAGAASKAPAAGAGGAGAGAAASAAAASSAAGGAGAAASSSGNDQPLTAEQVEAKLNLQAQSLALLPKDVDPYDLSLDPRKYVKHGSLDYLKVLDALVPYIKHQPALAQGVNLSNEAARTFGNYCLELAFSVQRVGILFGTVDARNVVFVETIYEPPQQGTDSSIKLLPDPDYARVAALAALFGWKPVGWVLSHSRREIHVQTHEILVGAELQSRGGDFGITLTCQPAGDGNFRYDCYQMSVQCQKMVLNGWFNTEQAMPDAVKVVPGRKVIVSGREQTVVPTLFLIDRVTPLLAHDQSLQCRFPPVNRLTAVSLDHFVRHNNSLKHRPFLERVSDWNVLVFVGALLSEEDLRDLVEGVRAKNTSAVEGFKYVIGDLVGVDL